MDSNPVIIALDTSSTLKALQLVRRLKITGVAFKIGFELFSAGGPRIVERIVGHDVRVFLDLKFHDIPNTVSRAVSVATSLGVWMLNVHTSGGTEMMKAAANSALETAIRQKVPPPCVVGVTVLTSLSDLKEINVSLPVDAQVRHLARLAQKAGLNGVVASAQEASFIRSDCGEKFTIVTPGIRFPKSPLMVREDLALPVQANGGYGGAAGHAPDLKDDQKRTMTPNEALESGADYLVIGRPVIESLRPLKVVDQLLSDLGI